MARVPRVFVQWFKACDLGNEKTGPPGNSRSDQQAQFHERIGKPSLKQLANGRNGRSQSAKFAHGGIASCRAGSATFGTRRGGEGDE